MVSSIIHIQSGDSKNTRPRLDGVRLVVSHKQKYDFALKYVFDGPKRQQLLPMSGICALGFQLNSTPKSRSLSSSAEKPASTSAVVLRFSRTSSSIDNTQIYLCFIKR